jgi:hypothetical protein
MNMAEATLNISPDSLLLVIAQLGLALGGFAGVAAAFWGQHSSLVGRSPAMRFLLDYPFGVLGFALFPFAIYQFSGDNLLTWRICSALLALFLAFELVWWISQVRGGLRIVHPWLFYIFYICLSFVIMAAERANIFLQHPFRLYFVGLMALLVPPSIQFCLFLVHKERYLGNGR